MPAEQFMQIPPRQINAARKSVDREAEQVQILEIQQISGKQKNRRQLYKAMLKANEERPPALKWPYKIMQKAAGINASDAARVRWSAEPDTPVTAEIRNFLDSFVPEEKSDTPGDRYRRALEENSRRPQELKWPDKSMMKAAGLSFSNAFEVREELKPDTPRTIEVRQFLLSSAPAHGKDNSSDRYRRALVRDSGIPVEWKWPDNCMQHAAGIQLREADSRSLDR
jgi:hypothetical protein